MNNSLIHRYSFQDVNILNSIRLMVVSSINTFLSTDGSIDLSMLHEIIDSSNVNKARLEAFNSINSTNWSQLFKTEMLDHVTSLIGPDLAIQRKINLSIQLPGDYSSKTNIELVSKQFVNGIHIFSW